MQLVNWSCLDFNLDRLLQSQCLPHSPFPFMSGIAKVVKVEVCRGWFSVYFPGVVWFLEYPPERISRFIHRMQAQMCGWGKSTGMVCRDELEGHTHHVHVLIRQQTCDYESLGKAGTEASVSCLTQALFPHLTQDSALSISLPLFKLQNRKIYCGMRNIRKQRNRENSTSHVVRINVLWNVFFSYKYNMACHINCIFYCG